MEDKDMRICPECEQLVERHSIPTRVLGLL